MNANETDVIAGEIRRPEPIANGAILDVDIGVPGTVVVTVGRGEKRYYETYELARVDARDDLVP